MKPSSDVFRPRLPVDPFAALDHPWRVTPDTPASAPAVVLLIGAPSQADVRPLLASQSLSDSLLLLATHAPPRLDPHPSPTVRILQLPAPVEELSALHIVSLLERAKHVVEGWRARRSAFGDNRIAVLTERFPGGDFALAAADDAAAICYPSPAPSLSNLRHSRILSKRKSLFSASTLSLPSATKIQSSLRTFDAIINFLPATLPEKDILKHAILVTSLSVPFLTCNKFPPLPTTDHSKRRFSSFLRSRHTTDDPDAHRVPTLSHAHLIHVLPSQTLSPSSSSTSLSSRGTTPSPSHSGRSSARTPSFISRHPRPSSSSLHSPVATHLHPHGQPMHSRMGSQSSSRSVSPSRKKPKLTQTLEQFLLSFAYSPHPTSPTPTNDLLGFQGKTVPYLLAPGVIGSHAHGRYEGERLAVGEAILLGLLDVCAKGEDVGKSLKSVAALSTRVWIGDARQVVLEGVDDVLSPAIVRLPPLAVPALACSPSGRDSSSESPTMTVTLNRYSRSSSPQSDQSSIKKPAAVVPKIPVSITPPIGPDVVDHPCNGLATTPDSSTENGGTEYETCETYATATADFAAHIKAVHEPDSYDPYQNAFFDPNWSRVDAEFGVLAGDAPVRKKGFFTGFRNLSKAVSMSGMAVSTIGQRRSVLRRERDVLRPVVV